MELAPVAFYEPGIVTLHPDISGFGHSVGRSPYPNVTAVPVRCSVICCVSLSANVLASATVCLFCLL